MTLSNTVKLLKDLKWLFAFFGSLGLTTVTHLDFAVKYNFHILVILIIFNIGGFVVMNYRMNSKEKVMQSVIQEQNETIQNSLKEQEKQRLKATVNTVFSEFKDIKVIDFESSAKYIYELEEKRVELGVNSFTEDKLRRLIEKIDLSK